MGQHTDLIDDDLDGINLDEVAAQFRAAASLTRRQLSGTMGWAQQRQDAQVYAIAYALYHSVPQPLRDTDPYPVAVARGPGWTTFRQSTFDPWDGPAMRADKIHPGGILAGFPNRTITGVERVTKDGWPKPWIRVTTERGNSHDYPPDWDLSVHERDDEMT
jgi:hypothetical protein